MKFLPKIGWKLQKLKKSTRVEVLKKRFKETQTKDTTTYVTKAKTTTTPMLKDEVMRNVCKDYRTQLELQLNYEKLPKIFPKATKESFMYDGSFHEAVGSVLLLAEFFAFMPIKGVSSPHPKFLSFSWKNVRTWYSLLFVGTVIIDLVLAMYKVFHNVITFNNIEPIIFRISIVIVCLSALSLARKWPALMMQWYVTESDLPQYHSQVDKRRMAYKIKMVTFVAMVMSLGEHLLSITSTIYGTRLCPLTSDPFKNFFLAASDELFSVFAYSHWLAFLSKLQNVLSTFIWNYMDVFVMIVSIGLSSKFKQLNDNLLKFKGMVSKWPYRMQMPEAFWCERRIQYRNLCILCEKIDNAISIITMVSYSNNLYFICVQLLKSLNKMATVVHSVYFYFSLFFLLGRTMALSLYTADVNDESKKPLRVLRCVPKESWSPEVKRFSDEISSDLVALSGMKFFHLTRKLVLSVAGTIVTYELVLIQFHEDDKLTTCS